MSYEPFIVPGGIAVDDRGQLTFANEFDLSEYKRFYNLQNHSQNFIRAWHGHKLERKAFFAQSGTFLVAAVKIDNWEKPSANLEIKRFILSAIKPTILIIPEGYANGSMSLTSSGLLTVFSNSTLEQSLNDDYRYESHYWNPWQVEFR